MYENLVPGQETAAHVLHVVRHLQGGESLLHQAALLLST
jgi:hypothetical protein